MKLHELKNVPGARHRTKRVGRGEGSGWGKTSGRGAKGQHSRAGSKTRPTFEGGQMPLIRRIPKRGFHNPTRIEWLAVNVGQLEALNAPEVTVELLRSAGLAKGRFDGVKILGTGTISKPITVHAHAFSATAKTKIEAAGGRCEPVSAAAQS
ncbi:MAG: 50S ribosomal protein L15 [Kiritimatiellia bacterium]|nr:50S ribosomal protein L15 [Kiritimatiellia bacterium]